MHKLTQIQLRKYLHYDPKTGIFTWRKHGGGTSPGEVAGYLRAHGYLKIRVMYCEYNASHLAWLYCRGKLPKRMDHINGKRADNRIVNLREVTSRQNAMNRVSWGVSKYRGVSQHGRGWVAMGALRGKRKYLGLFKSEKAAAKAYLAYALPICGEFLKARRA